METKPGIQTTEFWMHAVLQIILLLNTVQVWSYMPTKWSGAIQGVLAAAYAIGRGLSKQGIPVDGSTPTTVVNVPDAPAEDTSSA